MIKHSICILGESLLSWIIASNIKPNEVLTHPVISDHFNASH